MPPPNITTLSSLPWPCSTYLHNLHPSLPNAASANDGITLSPGSTLLSLGLRSRYRPHRGMGAWCFVTCCRLREAGFTLMPPKICRSAHRAGFWSRLPPSEMWLLILPSPLLLFFFILVFGFPAPPRSTGLTPLVFPSLISESSTGSTPASSSSSSSIPEDEKESSSPARGCCCCCCPVAASAAVAAAAGIVAAACLSCICCSYCCCLYCAT